MMADNTPIPFSFFVSLCRELSNIQPRSIGRGSVASFSSDVEPISVKVFRRWVQELRQRFPRSPSETTAILFFFLFPEEDTRRKYGMKEATLAKTLASVFGISDKDKDRGAGLKAWATCSSISAYSLGEQIYNLLPRLLIDTSPDDYHLNTISIRDVDLVLDELASKSSFSAACLREQGIDPSRTRERILQSAYRRLRPFEAAVLTQIILKDLRPVLYPIKNTSTTESLLNFNSNSVHVLSLQEAMRVWDTSGTLLRCFKVQSTIEHSVRLFEGKSLISVAPEIGVPIQISKCVKAQGCSDALKKLKSSSSIWAETKYDGERMQIHVNVKQDGHSEITIFSKSKRDSTFDRIATHWIVREALGLHHSEPEEICARAQPRTQCQKTVSSVILEAEMVAYDKDSGIDEYWRIRGLIESSARGPRRRKKFNQIVTESGTSRHLALVFFDILFLNGTTLLSESYCSRRAILESVIRPIPMYASLAYRVEIRLSGSKGFSQALEHLQRIFASSVENHEEGLVLKSAGATYAGWRCPWVKLKKDYIPGYGDGVDLVLLGATWEMERGRTLRVPTSTFTTFYVGAFSGESTNTRPHLEVLFTVSYGLDRRQLDELNLLVKSMNSKQYSKDIQREGLPFIFNLPKDLQEPSVLLTRPLLVEIFGAGFTKADETRHYELRFPRISKVYRTNDRSWLEGVNLVEFNELARRAVGKDKSVAHQTSELALAPQTPDLGETASTMKKRAAEAQAIRHVMSDHQDHKRRRIMEVTTQSRGNVREPLKSLTNNETVPEESPLSCGTNIPSGNIHCTMPGECMNNVGKIIGETSHPVPADELELHPFAAFLRRAVILLECGFCSRDYDSAFIDQFVIPNAVHSREAFALGCGWDRLTRAYGTCEMARCGAVFVDEQSIRDWCESPPFARHSSAHEMHYKPILVFSGHCLRKDALHGGLLDDGTDIKTKCLTVFL